MNGEQELPPTETTNMEPAASAAPVTPEPVTPEPVKIPIGVGSIIPHTIGNGAIRPVLISSVNDDGTVNGTIFLEPRDLAAWGPNPFFLSNIAL